jgi:hypothetical protein
MKAIQAPVTSMKAIQAPVTVNDSKTTRVIFWRMDILCQAQLHFTVELQIIDISLYRYMTYRFKTNPNTISV